MPSTITERLTGLTTSVAVKAPCVAATTANITLSGEQTIDGIAVVADDRVLVKDQSTAAENGIYVVSSGSWTRAKDFDGVRDAVKGSLVYIISGNANADTSWRLNTSGDIDFDTTSLSFIQASSSPTAIQNNSYTYCGSAGGTANAITIAPTPAITGYTAGQSFEFLPAATNTSGTVTIANSSLATRSLKKSIGGALVALAVGDLQLNVPARIIDDGTQYILENPAPSSHGADVASATTTVLNTVTGNIVDITGTTAITAFTLAEGRCVRVRAAGAFTLTHGASLICPTSANIVCAAGDQFDVVGYASGVVRIFNYQRLDGTSLVYSTGTWTPVVTFATPGNLNVVYSIRDAFYTKNARQVTATCAILCGTFTHTTASGDLQITGLPFAHMVTSGAAAVATVEAWGGITKANYTQVGAVLASGASLMTLTMSGSGQTPVTLSTVEVPTGAGFQVRITITYST